MEKDAASVILDTSVNSEKSKQSGGSVRRNSTGKTITRASLSPLNREEKLLPHYLRASTNSCHDFCKYGRKHAFESKSKKPVSPMLAKNTETPIQGQTGNSNLEERKKKPVIKLKALPEQKIGSPVKPVINKLKSSTPVKKIDVTAKSTISKPKSSSPAEKMRVCAKPRTSKLRSSSPAEKIDDSAKPMKIPKPKLAAANSPSSKSPRVQTGLIKNVKNMGLSKIGEKKELKPKLKPTTASVNGVSGLKPRKFNNPKPSLRDKNPNKVRNTVSVDGKSREKPSNSLESKHEDQVIEVVKHEIHNNRSSVICLSPYSSSLSSSLSTRSLSSKEEEMPELFECLESDSNRASNSDTKYYGTDNDKQSEFSKVQERRSLRRGSVVYLKDKDSAPQKLKFRRGRVISVQSENNDPRKLRFRQGRTLGETPNGKIESGRRSFKKKREVCHGNSGDPTSGPQTVVLRHQDVQGKKEEQDLNLVIEETANKLVETRKSKVKALVGAFETVISLQESKPVGTGLSFGDL